MFVVAGSAGLLVNTFLLRWLLHAVGAKNVLMFGECLQPLGLARQAQFALPHVAHAESMSRHTIVQTPQVWR